MLTFILEFLRGLLLPLITIGLYEYVRISRLRARQKSTQQHQQSASTPSPAANAEETVREESVETPREPTLPSDNAKPVEVKEEQPAAVEAASNSVPSPSASSAATAAASAPRILLAYASNSQTALALTHKLFSALSAELQQRAPSASAASGAGVGVVVPSIKILELREEEKNACTVHTLLSDPSYVLVVFVVSTFTDGAAPPRSQMFEAMLKDAYEDHRVSRDALSGKKFALFGIGDIAYGEANFNTFAKHLHTWCRGLGAPAFVVPPVYATEVKVQTLFRVFTTALLKWLSRAEFRSDGTLHVTRKAKPLAAAAAVTNAAGDRRGASPLCDANGESGETCACRKTTAAGGEEGERGEGEPASVATDNATGEYDTDGSESGGAGPEDDLEDVEDLVLDDEDDGNAMGGDGNVEPPELMYPKLRENLTKQGYHIVGSHSGVKLCRWTKSMLRGQGGCYKHTFYNISSAQCMEMTPSLACANKCVFCWRHHTNPVSRHFRWKQDPPELLIAGGLEGHQRMIKQMRGVPGVTPERLAQGMEVKHCALSLVGEPIMYPQVNRFCDLLHERHISSFMVTNAQFPDQLRDLKPVVQLYLSIDAPTPEELKRIDRPLFEDYWERCLQCVKELRVKKQRTVFRLTLVNEFNVDNIAAYADLVQLGWPDFIEVKGVTYCGTSNSSTLTMKKNVPRHDEVIKFCKALCAEVAARYPHYSAATASSSRTTTTTMESQVTSSGTKAADGDGNTDEAINEEKGQEHASAQGDDDDDDSSAVEIPLDQRNWPYHIACEHEHSCCVLITLDKFFWNGRWHTWIDYEKFYSLVESGATDFTSLDYALETPKWATYNSEEKGFDPAQTRVQRKKARPVGDVEG